MDAPARAPADEVRLAELIAALSLTTDLADGLPAETALKTCLLAVGLARRLGVSQAELSDTYYVGLLHNLGCTASAHETALAVGDDAFRRIFVGLDGEDSLRAMRTWFGGSDRLRRLAAAGDFVIHSQRYLKEGPVANCEVSSRLASRLSMSAGVVEALSSFFERWDGKGSPMGISGESVPLAARITRLAYMVGQHLWRGGDKRSVRVKVRRWAGSWVDPHLGRCSSPAPKSSSRWSPRIPCGTR
jgi:response regulator RpfG family c-di-GMP phosphodiesterase